ncbi:MAG: hypothetical protein KF886_19825 [Candidatus Hydrogenedentes bacterium]|nr:hypothetical protein [Candidatus Hydrogenedentota bacterium]
MPVPDNATKLCPLCGELMGINRGVCPNPDCTYQSTWFKIRLYFGCAGAIFAFILLLIMAWMALNAPQP